MTDKFMPRREFNLAVDAIVLAACANFPGFSEFVDRDQLVIEIGEKFGVWIAADDYEDLAPVAA